MIFKLEKFTYSDPLGPKNSLKRRRLHKGSKSKPTNLIEFNKLGQVIRDKL